ncbi:hypothetical protein CS542_01305 [Pedobacter sp. IW39]|nr:hypothetical protein CS542_01305 [Pedobacter sp. IW39]
MTIQISRKVIVGNYAFNFQLRSACLRNGLFPDYYSVSYSEQVITTYTPVVNNLLGLVQAEFIIISITGTVVCSYFLL